MSQGSLSGTLVLRRGGTVLLGLVAWNAGNYAFFLVAGRTLGPSDYGLLAALLAAVLVAAAPAQGLQFATARLLAAPPRRDAELAEGIYRRFRRRTAVATAALAICAFTLVAVLHGLGRAPHTAALITTIVFAAPLGFFFLALGRLQGEERFAAFTACFVLWGVPRPLVLVPLAALGLGVYAGLGATGVAMAAALLAAIGFARTSTSAHEPSRSDWQSFTRPLVPVAISLSALGILMNLDVVVAKIVLTAEGAGRFAATATLAKAVFLAPQAVSFVLFPRVAARSAGNQDTGMLLGLGVAVTIAVGALATLAVWMISDPLVRLTYGGGFAESARLLPAYTAASSLIGALIVIINHHIGRGANRFALGAGVLAVLQTLLFLALHGSQGAIVAVDAIVGATGLLLHDCIFFRTGEAIGPGLVRAVRVGLERRERRSGAPAQRAGEPR